MKRVVPSPIMELLKTAGSGEYISFASGLPDPALFPADALRESADAVLTEEASGALQYGPAEGYPPLRVRVAEMLKARGFANAAPENILLTSGSQQGLDLAARAYLDPGNYAALESPTYLAAIQIFDSYGAQYRALPQDEDGMDVEAAARALQAGCKLLFALPNFQNPTGRTLSAARREQLAAHLARHDALLLEDDAYYALRYEGDDLPPVSSLLPEGRALYTGTFSKTIAPGLRIGFIYGAPPVIARLTQLKQITDLHTGSLTQRVVHHYLTHADLNAQREKIRTAYRERRDVMLRALAREMPPGVAWTRPVGGMFLWVTLPPEMDGAALLEKAMARGLMFVPGAGFHPDGRGANTLRLNFVSARPPEIETGVRLLAQILCEQE